MRTIELSIVALAAAITAPGTARAQQEPGPDTVPRYEIEGVTVTSRRAPALRHELPQKIEIVTGDDLDRNVGDGVTDALKETLGLDVIQYPGLLSGVSVRGFRPAFSGLGTRTLILLDGRPAGVTNLATLDASGLAGVEVLKGPASALHGSSAMGGTINFISRDSRGPLSGRIAGGFGEYAGYTGDLRVGGNLSPALDFDLTLATAGREGGYRVGANRLLGGDSVTKVLADGGTVRLAEIFPDSAIGFSDYSTRSGSLRVGYDLDDRWRVSARAGYFAGEDVQNPGDLIAGWGQTLNDLERRTADASLTGLLGAHALTGRVYASRERTTYYDDPFEPEFVSSRSPVTTRGLQLQDAVSFGPHSATFGIDHHAARAASERYEVAGVASPPYAPDSETRSTAAFAELAATLLDGRLRATLGGRLDRLVASVDEGEIWDFATATTARVDGRSETHHVFNPSAGVRAELGAGLALHASGGRAFVAPDAFHVAGYSEARPDGRRAVRITQGNPALAPESSVSWDLGLAMARPRDGFDADLTYFSTRVRDRVVAAAVPVEGVRLTAAGDTILGILSYVNANRAEIAGLEGRVSYEVPRLAGRHRSLRLFANGTRILRAVERAGDASERIRNVADVSLVGGVDVQDRRGIGARVSARYVGERLDSDFTDWMNPGDVRYPAFLVLDAAARVRLAGRLTVTAAVDNLLDENYYEVRGYNLPGRSLRVGAAVEF